MKRLLVLLASFSTIACGPKRDGTTLVVSVQSDLQVGSQIDTVQIIAAGELNYSFSLNPGSTQSKFPIRVALIPGGQTNRQFDVEAVGVLRYVPVVSQSATVSFVPGSEQEIVLFLGRACEPSPLCPADSTCQKGICVAKVDAGARGPFTSTGTGGIGVSGSGGTTSSGGGMGGSGGRMAGTGGRATGGGTGSGGFTSTGTGGGSGGFAGTGTGTGGFTSTGTGGFTSTGTGGSSGTVGGTGGTVGGTGGPATGGGIVVSGGGHGTNGTWMGYGYTSTFGTAATISPVCPMPCFPQTATQLCAMGTVGPDTTLVSGALLGWNINQSAATTAVAPPINSVTPTGTGLYLNVSGGTAGLRVDVQAATGANWCALLTGSSPSMIPWTMFNSACYNTAAGTPYTLGTPITTVQIVVPSTAAATVPFNFCLVDAHPY